jgi:hypothetical protein
MSSEIDTNLSPESSGTAAAAAASGTASLSSTNNDSTVERIPRVYADGVFDLFHLGKIICCLVMKQCV